MNFLKLNNEIKEVRKKNKRRFNPKSALENAETIKIL